MKRITKRQQLINELTFDIEALKEGITELESTKKFQFMYQGDLFTRYTAEKRIQETENYLKTLK